jgi:hypothetical protein
MCLPGSFATMLSARANSNSISIISAALFQVRFDHRHNARWAQGNQFVQSLIAGTRIVTTDANVLRCGRTTSKRSRILAELHEGSVSYQILGSSLVLFRDPSTGELIPLHLPLILESCLNMIQPTV